MKITATGVNWSGNNHDKPAEQPPNEFDTAEDRMRIAARMHEGSLRILCWNADEIKLNIREFSHRVKELALAQESNLRDEVKNPEISGYSYACV